MDNTTKTSSTPDQPQKQPVQAIAPRPNQPGAGGPSKNQGGPRSALGPKNVQQQLAKNKQAANKVKEIRAEAAKVPVDYEAKARRRRKKRAIRLVQKLLVFVVLPTVAAAVYYGIYAKDQFQSNCSFAVKTEGKGGMGVESILGSFAASGSSQEAMTVQNYILSRDMLHLLVKEHDFIKHYKNPKIDYLARLSRDATFEDAFEYYLDMVEAQYDVESGMLTLEVKAFDAKSAHNFATAILKNSEAKVNQMSEKMQNDKITFTQNVVNIAETRLTNAQKALLELQKKQVDFSPNHSAQALMGVKNKLEAQLAMAQTELNEAQAIMAPTAPQVLVLSQRVQSIKKQIKKENTRLLGNDENGLGLNIAEFEMAMLEKKFAEKEYASSMVSLEMARLEAMKQSRYLAEISTPSLPDEAIFPKRGLKVLTVFLVSLAIFGILSLLLAAVKEHARI